MAKHLFLFAGPQMEQAMNTTLDMVESTLDYTIDEVHDSSCPVLLPLTHGSPLGQSNEVLQKQAREN